MRRSAMAHGRISAKEKWRALKQTQASSIIQTHRTCARALTQSEYTHTYSVFVSLRIFAKM